MAAEQEEGSAARGGLILLGLLRGLDLPATAGEGQGGTGGDEEGGEKTKETLEAD